MDIAILGCGYVGLELGAQLNHTDNTVIGVRRSISGIEKINQAGLESVRADVTDASTLSDIPDVDTIVFAASSSGRGVTNARETYETGLRTVVDHFGHRSTMPERLIYTSSTGVYRDHDGAWVDESTPVTSETPRQEILITAEEITRDRSSKHGMDWTIVRLGGIYGPGRYRLNRYLEGPVTSGYLNLIHRDDAAGVIRYLVETMVGMNEIVLGVDDEPVDKWEVADWFATYCDKPEPPKQTIEERLASDDVPAETAHRIAADKRCSNAKLRRYGYEFTYPTYRDGYRAPLEEYCG